MYGLDLFSGIGGITKALEGYVEPVAYCENDRYCQAVLLSRMASGQLQPAPIWDDVLTLRGDMLPHPIEIIYGGFPCQDISVAGRGAGLAGERSGLFFEIIRLVGEIRPRFVFLENSPAIRTRGADIVAAKMAGLGYDCRWNMLSASDVGAHHFRRRWFLLAHSNSERLEERGIPERQERETLSDVAGRSEIISDSEGTELAGIGRNSRNGRSEFRCSDWWKSEPRVARVANGIPNMVDRIKCSGNAVVPLQAREAFERLMGLK